MMPAKISDSQQHNNPAACTLQTIRKFVLALFFGGLLVTGAELLLLEHMKDWWQRVPLFLIGISLIVLGWHLADGRLTSLRAFQLTMLLFVASGVTGLWLHYWVNVEFELEMYPSMQGFELLWAALQGAIPALAPVTMSGFGLLGLVFTYGHPASKQRT